MMINSRCRALKNSSYQDDDIRAIKIGLLDNCKYILMDVLYLIIESLKMPYILTFHKTFEVLFDAVVENRSDIGAAYFTTQYQKFDFIDYSPMVGYGSLISILSGKIFANTGNQFNIFNSFPIDLWIIFAITLIIVAIFEIFLHFKARYSLVTFLIEIFSNLFYFLIRFLNQDSNKYSRICCLKHLILNSTIFLSIFLMMLLFNSEILSNIVYNPLLHIDSLGDLAQFIATHPDVSLISDNSTSSWEIMKTWQDDQMQILFQKMQGVFVFEFDYQQVYCGKTIIVFFDDYLARKVKPYPSLKFHLSNDRHFVTQFGIIYSKFLNINIKENINMKIQSVVESGLNAYWKSKTYSKKLKISDLDESHQTISLDYFQNVLMLFLFIYIIIIIIFVIEYAITRFDLLTEIILRRLRVKERFKVMTVPSPMEVNQLDIVSMTWLTCSVVVLRIPNNVILS